MVQDEAGSLRDKCQNLQVALVTAENNVQVSKEYSVQHTDFSPPIFSLSFQLDHFNFFFPVLGFFYFSFVRKINEALIFATV